MLLLFSSIMEITRMYNDLIGFVIALFIFVYVIYRLTGAGKEYAW